MSVHNKSITANSLNVNKITNIRDKFYINIKQIIIIAWNTSYISSAYNTKPQKFIISLL